MNTAAVSEIFTTIQGEGPYTGEKQIFLRMAGCPLRCDYCDTPGSLVAKGHKVLTVDAVFQAILKEDRKQNVKTVSVTGGEPLVYSSFLQALFLRLKDRNFRIYLETAGVHPNKLMEVVDQVDVIAMDIKLPSATGRSFWNEHQKFLNVGLEKIFAKVVIERNSKLWEVKKVVELLSKHKHPPLLVLQPVTPLPPLVATPTSVQLSQAYEWAKNFLPQVLIMPQQHKIWDVR
jgi:7-carboxy-7-deazaguanine synthase